MAKHELREMTVNGVFMGHYIQGNADWMGGYKTETRPRYKSGSGWVNEPCREKIPGHHQAPNTIAQTVGKPRTKKVPWTDKETLRLIRTGALRVSGALVKLTD